MGVNGTHRCPARTRSGRCTVYVSDQLLACVKHWNQLSPATMRTIRHTASMPLLSVPRRAALAVAREEWAKLP